MGASSYNECRHASRTTLLACASVFIISLGLAGCQTLPGNEGAPATVADVIAKLKDDLREYQNYDGAAAAAAKLPNVCEGIVGFDIDNVKIGLTTKTDDKAGGSASATLPVGPAATFGPTFSGSQQTTGTQTLTFFVYPKRVLLRKSDSLPPPIDANRYPIAASLQQLRDGLLAASDKEPCMWLAPQADEKGKVPADPGGTFAFGFVVINTVGTGATLKFVVFSLGATSTTERQAGNAITVTFKARPGSQAFTM